MSRFRWPVDPNDSDPTSSGPSLDSSYSDADDMPEFSSGLSPERANGTKEIIGKQEDDICKKYRDNTKISGLSTPPLHRAGDDTPLGTSLCYTPMAAEQFGQYLIQRVEEGQLTTMEHMQEIDNSSSKNLPSPAEDTIWMQYFHSEEIDKDGEEIGKVYEGQDDSKGDEDGGDVNRAEKDKSLDIPKEIPAAFHLLHRRMGRRPSNFLREVGLTLWFMKPAFPGGHNWEMPLSSVNMEDNLYGLSYQACQSLGRRTIKRVGKTSIQWEIVYQKKVYTVHDYEVYFVTEHSRHIFTENDRHYRPVHRENVCVF